MQEEREKRIERVEEITDIIEQLKTRYTPKNFKKLDIKVGKVLTFDYEGTPVPLEITAIVEGRYWAKHVELHEPNVVSSHYRHNVDSTEETIREYGVPFCQDCEIPVSQEATREGRERYETRKERYLSDGTPIDDISDEA